MLISILTIFITLGFVTVIMTLVNVMLLNNKARTESNFEITEVKDKIAAHKLAEMRGVRYQPESSKTVSASKTNAAIKAIAPPEMVGYTLEDLMKDPHEWASEAAAKAELEWNKELRANRKEPE